MILYIKIRFFSIYKKHYINVFIQKLKEKTYNTSFLKKLKRALFNNYYINIKVKIKYILSKHKRFHFILNKSININFNYMINLLIIISIFESFYLIN